MWRKHRHREQWVKGKTMAIKKKLDSVKFTLASLGNCFPGVHVKWLGTKAVSTLVMYTLMPYCHLLI